MVVVCRVVRFYYFLVLGEFLVRTIGFLVRFADLIVRAPQSHFVLPLRSI